MGWRIVVSFRNEFLTPLTHPSYIAHHKIFMTHVKLPLSEKPFPRISADAELKPAKRVKKKPAEAKTPTTESTEDKEEKPASKTKEKVKKSNKTEKVEG